MIYEYPGGLTVADLKDILRDWPETGRDGLPTEVWLLDGDGLSNVALSVGPMMDDLLIQHGATYERE